MGFKEDLKSGEDVEMEILAILHKEFPEAHKPTDKKTREFYDVIVPISEDKEIWLEIKNDKYVSKNMAFECLGSKSRNTGIIKTLANYWIHVRSGKYYIWKLGRIKKYLLDLGGHIKMGGDRNETGMWVVPEIKVLAECKPDIIINRGSDELNEFLKKNI